MDAPADDAAALTRPLALPYTLTPAFHANTGPVVVLMSGWPDQPATLYASLLPRLAAAGYRPALVDLPGYPPPAERPLPPRWWGWDFPQIVSGYAAAVRAIQAAAAAAASMAAAAAAGGGDAAAAGAPTPLEPVTFVAHDWGAMLTWRLVDAHPSLARAVVGADVGDVAGMAAVQVLFCAAYMSALAALFVVGGPVGDAATRWLAALLGAPHPAGAAARMNAPYYWTRRGVVPACPTLYLYGTKKGNFQYHSPEFLANLTARPDCRVVPLDDAHWLMAGPAAAEYEAAVLGWLANTIGTAEAAPAVAAAAAAPASAAAATAGGEDKKDV